VRKNSHVLINLLMLMIVGELEQLNDNSIMNMISKLKLNMTEEEAEADFKK